jgi:ubiquinone/menaquinone biosynthesis C-methylase UbiE
MQVSIDRPTQAWLDFVQGLKGYNYGYNTAEMRKIFTRKAAEHEAATGEAISDWTQVGPLLEHEPSYQFYGLSMRQTQEMMWDGVQSILDKNRERVDEHLHSSIENPKGSLRLRPEITIPRYYDVTEYHLRPGGMHNGEDQGFRTTIANVIYFAGENDSIKMQRWAASCLPETRDDGQPFRRVLDMGCGIGQSTWPLAEQYPQAEIHGCDLSAPLLTYAHRVAEEKGLAIHYAQNDAAHTDYPDEHFDLVFAFIMFHEISNVAAREVIAEAYRLLEPGGIFAFCDIRPYKKVGPFQAFISDWQTQNNEEFFWRGHCMRDYHKIFAETGFVNVEEKTGASPTNMVYVAHKPA